MEMLPLEIFDPIIAYVKESEYRKSERFLGLLFPCFEVFEEDEEPMEAEH
ncbi:hypothetical protein SNOG_05989 [Parastagonospora nodorum SN15]|uniref:Uncharacterized protein n=1 Tax=Phaeosphaeria nodorum (strain SN15 / ATCC MYA-4574 / FGSC 10173) TaxID=321614 RepID=Q0UQH5_PHANO|nr:hypothetical protein SNOG_05989 [Parastagonospora nodorum SN15]EAT87053.1 hypothetical protein SNOG_05989 [Parastagonospora nodorum SN15]